MNGPGKQPSAMQQILRVVLGRRSENARQRTNQGTSSLQGTSNHSAESASLPVQLDIYERMEEYRAVLEHQSQLSTRRHHINDVYIGLNTIFLTALGVLLLQSHLDTWWVFAVVCAMTIIILPINVNWRSALLRYQNILAQDFDYLREIEQEFRTRRGNVANQPEIGLISRRKEGRLRQKSNTQLEIQLATYFIYLYPVISLVVGILVYLIQAHIIAPLKIV